MATIGKEQILSALMRLGALASAEGQHVSLLLLGGAAMVLEYGARLSTHDVDAVVLEGAESSSVRRWVLQVAKDEQWPDDWMNDAAKGYLVGTSQGSRLLDAPGIIVHALSTEQLLAMKLCAWRDDVDINDARLLLQNLKRRAVQTEIWRLVLPYLIPGRELKAEYAFADLWESFDDIA